MTMKRGIAIVSIAIVLTAVFAVGVFAATQPFGDAKQVQTGPSECAIRLTSATTQPGYGGVSFTLPAGTTVSSITSLTADFKASACAGGSPRFSIGTASGNIFVYLGDLPNFTCSTARQQTGNLLATNDLRVDTSQVGGTFYDTWAHAVALVGSQAVTGVDFVVDSGWAVPGGTQTVDVYSVTVNDQLVQRA